MNVTLYHESLASDGAFGRLRDEQDQDICVTLEHTYLVNGVWTVKLIDGVYPCVRYASPKFHREVFVVTHVPGHSMIELHIGNRAADSEGCLLLGRHIIIWPGSTDRGITASAETFSRFMALQAGLSTFTLTVRTP